MEVFNSQASGPAITNVSFHLCSILFFKKYTLFLSFWFIAKLSRKYRDFLYTSKNQLTTFMRVYFQALSSVLEINLSILPLIPHCLNCCSLTVGHEVRQCQSSNLILFQCYSGSFASPCKFQNQFSNTHTITWWDSTESKDQVGKT